MEDDLTLPLSMLRPIDIRKASEPGIVLPIQPGDPAIAITIWDKKPFGLVLDGPHAFSFFQIDARAQRSGVFIPAPEIVVSVRSAVRGEAVWQQRGALILEDGHANVVASQIGDRWGEVVNMPLWQEVDFQASEGKTIGFTEWRLRVADGREHRVVWRSPEQADQAE